MLVDVCHDNISNYSANITCLRVIYTILFQAFHVGKNFHCTELKHSLCCMYLFRIICTSRFLLRLTVAMFRKSAQAYPLCIFRLLQKENDQNQCLLLRKNMHIVQLLHTMIGKDSPFITCFKPIPHQFDEFG